jgi:hypothetical protein
LPAGPSLIKAQIIGDANKYQCAGAAAAGVARGTLFPRHGSCPFGKDAETHFRRENGWWVYFINPDPLSQ